MKSAKVNNYDIIRIVAALQVAYVHGFVHLKVDQPQIIERFVKLFPGVPIFFFISGVLISMSWENNDNVREYARNRILRIYPALLVCLVVSVASAFAAGYLWNGRVRVPVFAAWIVGQSTVVQFFNPGFMRQYGTGVLNGSLSTITTELQFYVLVPLTYWAFRIKARRKSNANVILAALIVVFLAANTEFIRRGGQYTELLSMKLADVSFLPWFYMFLCGVLVQRNLEKVVAAVRGKALLLGAVYLFAAWLAQDHLGWRVSNEIHPVLFVLLASFVMSCAYTAPTLSGRVLQRNDISYGLYIYHMPVYNFLLYKGATGESAALFGGLLLSFVLAMLSWRVIERPMMKRKRHTTVHVQPEPAVTAAPVSVP